MSWLGVYHLAAEERFGQSPGLQAVHRIVSGDVVNDVEGVQREVFSFYEAIFQGCRSAAVDAAAPVDSRTPFVRDEPLFPMFHTGLPHLSPDERAFLETPFTYEEFAVAVEKVANGNSPDLNGLSYEF